MAKRKRKNTIVLFVPIWIMLAVFFGSAITMQMSKYHTYKEKERELLAEMDKEREHEEELNKELQYYESDAYVEKVAREKLGLVRPGEILFYNEPGK